MRRYGQFEDFVGCVFMKTDMTSICTIARDIDSVKFPVGVALELRYRLEMVGLAEMR